MTSYEHAVAATQGARDYQEDTAAFWPLGAVAFRASQSDDANAAALPNEEGGFAVLADGMGGHTGGALASRTVCEAFLAAASAPKARDLDLRSRLKTGLEAANGALAAKVDDNPLLSGMGSTLIGAAFSKSGLEWISVGDSPLYLYRRGEVAVLNEDHSLAPELDRLVAAGRLTEEEARRDPRRHMLRSAVTGEEIDMIDVSRRPLALESGDYVVLASDGVESLDQLEIGRIIQGYAADGAEAVARALIRGVEALREPYQDNATVLVVRAID
ncbi:MAG TPA: protein phosphatase 2C domain-containing protein [Hyphomicrobium sp.]|nr:protein phosphatase 2C domain-containing protein [Hyphomicrobium sp.]